MGIGFPHDRLIADCGLRIADEEGEWGQKSYLTTPHSPFPTTHSLLHQQSLPNPVSLV
jgi:hypothetical protein